MKLTVEQIQQDIQESLKRVADTLIHVSQHELLGDHYPELRQNIIHLAERAALPVNFEPGKINAVILTTELIDEIVARITEIENLPLRPRYISKTDYATTSNNISKIRELLKLFINHFSSEEGRAWYSAKALFGALESPENKEQRAEAWMLKKEAEVNQKFGQLNASLTTLEQQVLGKLSLVDNLYDSEKKYLDDKRRDIDNALGHLSVDAIARGYDVIATEEKNAANFFRAISIAIMSLIVITLTNSLHENEPFLIDSILPKILLSLILSVPAAYLARESSRHREKYYSHKKISLEMNALGPFVAPLTDDEQKRIRSTIALRMFANEVGSKSDADTYPINAQELIIKCIDVINKKSESTKKDGE